MTNAEKIQAVIDTLQQLQLPATYDNMSRLLGSLQALGEIRDEMTKDEVDDDVQREQ